MPTPSKSIDVIVTDNKKHLTKDEIAKRKQAEKALSTGVALVERFEVASNPIAHAEFERVNDLLAIIGKNDAIYEPVINRYCSLQAECVDFMEKREYFYNQMMEMQSKSNKIDASELYRLQTQMQKTIIDIDKQVQSKRKMLFDIERENAMTISAALRSIPKKKIVEDDPLKAALKGG